MERRLPTAGLGSRPAAIPPNGSLSPRSNPFCRDRYLAIQEHAPEHLDHLNASQRERLFLALSRHPVAGVDQLDRYDPTGEIGFCFGRAMAAHLLARGMGLRRKSLRKVFMVGDLREGGRTLWRFHTATAVTGEDETFHVIDPILPHPLPLARWIAAIRGAWDPEKKARVYLTPSDAVMPDVRIFPAKEEERGERIIELAFTPDGKPGFRLDPALPVVHVAPDASDRYFLGMGRNPDTRFDFLGITINGNRWDYHGYFADLLASLSGCARPIGISFPGGALRAGASGVAASREAVGRLSMGGFERTRRAVGLASPTWGKERSHGP